MVHASTIKKPSREHRQPDYGPEGMRDNNPKIRVGQPSYLLA